MLPGSGSACDVARGTAPIRSWTVALADELEPGVDSGAREIAALTSRVLAAWRKRLRRMNDAHPRAGDRGECERHLVAALLRVAEVDDEQWLTALAAAAARYATEQPRGRLDPSGLSGEFAALRQIVLKQLTQRAPAEPEVTFARSHRLDRAISIVAKAAGFSEVEPRVLNGRTDEMSKGATLTP